MGPVLFILGLLVVALVLIQLALGVYSTFLNIARQRERSQLSLQLLEERIKTAGMMRDRQMSSGASWNQLSSSGCLPV